MTRRLRCGWPRGLPRARRRRLTARTTSRCSTRPTAAPGAEGTARLVSRDSPFGVARHGRRPRELRRQHHASGLPEPGDAGRFTALRRLGGPAPISSQWDRLGAVHNGTIDRRARRSSTSSSSSSRAESDAGGGRAHGPDGTARHVAERMAAVVPHPSALPRHRRRDAAIAVLHALGAGDARRRRAPPAVDGELVHAACGAATRAAAGGTTCRRHARTCPAWTTSDTAMAMPDPDAGGDADDAGTRRPHARRRVLSPGRGRRSDARFRPRSPARSLRSGAATRSTSRRCSSDARFTGTRSPCTGSTARCRGRSSACRRARRSPCASTTGSTCRAACTGTACAWTIGSTAWPGVTQDAGAAGRRLRLYGAVSRRRRLLVSPARARGHRAGDGSRSATCSWTRPSRTTTRRSTASRRWCWAIC